MRKLFPLTLFIALVIAGCSENDKITTTGSLKLKVTDDPFNINFIESATVTITKIEIRRHDYDEGNPFMILSTDTFTVDLLKLRNGITEELLDLEVPAGSYDLIRLYIEEAGLKVKERPGEFNVKVPSGKQTGIKIFISPVITVQGGLTSELLLDFDLSRSFVIRGNMAHNFNGFIFKPCIRATNNSVAGRIEGIVTDTLKARISNAKVWLSRDSVLSTSFTDTLGYYAIIGVPAGTYTLSATKENFDTVSYTGIKVIEANRLVRNFELTSK